MTALDQLSKLAAKITAANEARGPLIAQARDEGATWEQIAAALNMSRAGVIKLANSSA